MCNNIITAVSKRIEDLKIVRNEYFHALKDNVPNDSFIDICERIKKEKKSLSASIVQRQNSKYQRDNISYFNCHQQNRRFDALKNAHNRERKIIHKKYEKVATEQAQALCPDQNAINLSTEKLTDAEIFIVKTSFIYS